MIPVDQHSLQNIFKHYEDLTNLSGLKLNADKTEIITNSNVTTYNIIYLGERHEININSSMKVNGLILSYDSQEMYDINFRKLYGAMEKQLVSWSNRGLSLLGKILIYKTFGLSQILFIGSVMNLTKKDNSKITELIYRFIWNRDMNKLKAPDRIKRQILNRPIRELGFGMIDFNDILRSIRIKTVIRLFNNAKHPLGKIIRCNTNSSWVKISAKHEFRPPLSSAIRDISHLWKIHLLNTADHTNELLQIISREYIGNLIERRHQNKRLCITHKHDSVHEILTTSWNHSVMKKIGKDIKQLLDRWDGPRITNDTPENCKKIPLNNRLIDIDKITSNMIRKSLTPINANYNYKILGEIDATQRSGIGSLIKNLNNVKLKSIILRAIHGDIYSASRMKKFGMTDNNLCPRCGKEETIEHMILACEYTKKIWSIISKLTNIPHNSMRVVLGINPTHDKSTLTINAEIIRQLMAILQTYY